MITIAIDAMGGDFGPRVTLPAVLKSLEALPQLHVHLYGNEKKLQTKVHPRLKIIHCEDEIHMDDKPARILRGKPDASMRRALESVHANETDGCVSAGNTGALMALGRLILKTHVGIDRPAIVSSIPTHTGECIMLDLGANVGCSSEQLRQFAVMGALQAQIKLGIKHPKVGLLNVGSEDIKGTEQVKLASMLIKELDDINYIGFIEGNDIYEGTADVVVCDGFVGNITLKASEGLISLVTHYIREEFSSSLTRRLIAYFALPILMKLKNRLSPTLRNGASFLGLQGVVIKSHGNANEDAFYNAIIQAHDEIESGFCPLLTKRMESLQI
jgi:glycerol-3-phosphate acyltransferase PlsX